ncbi:MAG: hypothetical protein ACLBM2_08410, partial [Dolichospermum sp.]
MKMILFKDVRDYQILFLSLFLIIGVLTRDWTLHPEFIDNVVYGLSDSAKAFIIILFTDV